MAELTPWDIPYRTEDGPTVAVRITATVQMSDGTVFDVRIVPDEDDGVRWNGARLAGDATYARAWRRSVAHLLRPLFLK